MYINDVIKDCDRLCPNEYSKEEKLLWIDELNAIITQETLKKYAKVTCEIDIDGEFVLPEGVTFEMIDRFIVGGREIDKVDFRSFGIQYLYGRRGRYIKFTRDIPRAKIDVVYLIPPQAIKYYFIEDGECGEDLNGGYVIFEDSDTTDKIETGDMVQLVITVNTDNVEKKHTVVVPISEITKRINEVQGEEQGPVQIGAIVSDEVTEGATAYRFDGDIYTGIELADVVDVTMERYITDETIPPAPYDVMYIDWLCAKITFYQRDFRSYYQNMQRYKDQMAGYRVWLNQRRVTDKDGVFTNWW